MKQSFYATGMLMLFAFTASAQKSETALLTTTTAVTNPFLIEKGEVKTGSTGVAEERFRKDFKNVQNVEWTVKADGYRVYFTQDNVMNAVDYSKKGNMTSVIRYGKSLLTKDVARMIGLNYSNASIKEVSEVKIAGYSSKVYVVLLEDATSMKTVQILDGEIALLHEESK